MNNIKAVVITNPYSGKNKPHSFWVDTLQKLGEDVCLVKETRNLEQLKTILEEALENKIPYIICDGGDGTVHWIINTFLEIFEENKLDFEENIPILIPTNGGTIDFIAYKIGTTGGSKKIIPNFTYLIKRGKNLPKIHYLQTFTFKGIQQTGSKKHDFHKLGFAASISGLGPNFFKKYYKTKDPGVDTVVKIMTKVVISYLGKNLGKNSLLRPFIAKDIMHYNKVIFKPMKAKVLFDGKELPIENFTTINAGSIHVNIKNLLQFFPKADNSNKLQVDAGDLTPTEIVQNIAMSMMSAPRAGKKMVEQLADTMDVYTVNDNDHFSPIIDGEFFEGLTECHLTIGPKIPMIGMKA